MCALITSLFKLKSTSSTLSESAWSCYHSCLETEVSVASPLSGYRAGSGGVQKSQARTKGPNEWATFLPLLRLVLLIVRPDGGGGSVHVQVSGEA